MAQGGPRGPKVYLIFGIFGIIQFQSVNWLRKSRSARRVLYCVDLCYSNASNHERLYTLASCSGGLQNITTCWDLSIQQHKRQELFAVLS